MEPRLRLAHLLRRAGFGPAPGELDAGLGRGYEAVLQSLLEPGATDDGMGELDHQIGELLDFSNIDDVRTWWIYRMIHGRRPLIEKMTFFWHGHFATAVSKVNNPYAMYVQNQLLRDHGLGKFEDLLQRIAQDPAMLIYLDGASNHKAHPNENFAREVMELFTVGVGHYTEADVQEAARAFTGWNLRDDAFEYNFLQHDRDPKTFMGHTGLSDGGEILHLLAEHPATAERLSRKLFEFFIYENPDRKTLAPIIKVWTDTKGDIREVLRALFLSPAFSSEKAAYRARIKSPAEYVIGAIRSLGGTIAPRQAVGVMARMGQDLFNPPTVKGWDGGMAWISTSTIFERFNFAASVTTARGPQGTNHINPDSIFNGLQPTTAEQMVDLAVEHLLDGRLDPAAREVIVKYLETPDPQGQKDGKGLPAHLTDRRAFDEKSRGMIHLLLSTPEFQLS